MKANLILNLLLCVSIIGVQCSLPQLPKKEGEKNVLETTQVSTVDAKTPIKPAVAPPIKGADIPFKTFSTQPNQENTFTMATGTSIQIPVDALIDANGNPIKEPVDIKFREFHTAADLILSGIKMQNEKGEYLETAGMFELRASTETGTEVFINPKKNITVNLASDVQKSGFDFLYLNEKTAEWETIIAKNDQPKENTKKKKRLKELGEKAEKEKNSPIGIVNKHKLVFDFEVDYSFIPELKPFHGVLWEYAGQGNFDNSIFEKEWASVSLRSSAKKGIYLLDLKKGAEAFSTEVRPVLKKGDYEAQIAKFEQDMKQSNTIKQANEQEIQRIQSEKDFMRSALVANFGIHNWDIWKKTDRKTCILAANFDDKSGYVPEIHEKNINFYLVEGTNKSIIQYDSQTLNKFSFDPAQKNILIALLPNHKIAIYTSENFAQIKKVLEHEDRNKIIAYMKTMPHEIKTVQDLSKMIEIVL